MIRLLYRDLGVMGLKYENRFCACAGKIVHI